MLIDLLWFLVILGVFITAFGVTATSLLYRGNMEPIQYLHMFLRLVERYVPNEGSESEPQNCFEVAKVPIDFSI